MTRALTSLAVCIALASPVAAQGQGETERGFDLLREGSRLILEGLMDDMRRMLEALDEIAFGDTNRQTTASAEGHRVERLA